MTSPSIKSGDKQKSPEKRSSEGEAKAEEQPQEEQVTEIVSFVDKIDVLDIFKAIKFSKMLLARQSC